MATSFAGCVVRVWRLLLQPSGPFSFSAFRPAPFLGIFSDGPRLGGTRPRTAPPANESGYHPLFDLLVAVGTAKRFAHGAEVDEQLMARRAESARKLRESLGFTPEPEQAEFYVVFGLVEELKEFFQREMQKRGWKNDGNIWQKGKYVVEIGLGKDFIRVESTGPRCPPVR